MASLHPGSWSPDGAARGNARPTALGHATAALLFPLVVSLVAGCGGSDEPPKPTGAQAAAPVENPVNAPAEELPVAPRPAPRKPAVAAQAEPPALDPSINPHDVFEVAATEPTFERAAGPDGPVSMNTLDATFPPKGSTSSNFQADQSPESQPVASHASAEEPPPAKRTDKPTAKGHSSTKSAHRESGDRSDAEKRSDLEKTDSESKKSLPPGFRPIASFGDSPVGWPLRIRSKIDGAEMALVSGGAVTVGHDGDPPESSPQLTVVLDSFYMDLTEVTLDRYERYRKAINEERGRHAVQPPDNASSPPDFPVLGVTLKQAEFYAHWAQKELPTEAEWERAARGESAFAHPWGNGRAIWRQARKPDSITAVRTFGTDVSPYGIYDLAGNAREWCSDRWSATAFAEAQKNSRNPLRNWKGARTAEPADFHVVKGNGPGWDAWFREGLSAVQHHRGVGFRCVLRLSEKN
jgi:formylglycine-generating enzyme required for sulfatase activity